MAQGREFARRMMVKATMTERSLNLVVPLAHEATDMRIRGTADSVQARSRAVSPLIGSDLRQGDVHSTTLTLPILTMPGIRTSTTATRTTTTSTTSSARVPSADRPAAPHADFSELVQAYFACRQNKRNSASALAFEQRLERNLAELHDELVNFAYQPGRSICFVITRPKPREVWAAEFRDRIVHHLLYNRIAPRFYKAFIADSCACIPGRGTLYAARRLEAKIRSASENWSKPLHYLKCDLANFFVSIDKYVVWEQLAGRIPEPWWRWLAHTVLFHDPRDDFEYRGARELLERVPARLHARLNPAKTILQPVARGVDFVGHIIKPWHTVTRRRTFHGAIERLREAAPADLHQSANSYFGLLRQATASHTDRARIAKVLLQRGRTVNKQFTKTYRTHKGAA